VTSSRAAPLASASPQEYLERELERLVARPSMHAWLEPLRERERSADRRMSGTRILKHRDADRW
jgi:hypothetical protein